MSAIDQACDFLVVGAGIAGASVAYSLAPHGKVLVIERETSAGYHTTGRSAALFFDSYGGPGIRLLTRASRGFLLDPPTGFSETPLMRERGAMFVARHDQLGSLQAHIESVQASADAAGAGDAGPNMRQLSPEQVHALVPIFEPGYVAMGIHEPDAMDMDVAAIHQGFLRGARRHGAELLLDQELRAVERDPGTGRWRVQTRGRRIDAGVIVNAAGAWADEVATLAGVEPVGIVPKRRTVIVVAPSLAGGEPVDCSRWPLTADMDEQFYFKPDAGRLWISPADETPMPPCDAQPDEMDIAVLVDRMERATTLRIRRIEHSWAGLRSFVADKNLVIGADDRVDGFFWLAGQGGYGIQTSAAAGELAAALIRGQGVPTRLADIGIRAEDYGVERLRQQA